MSSAVFLTIALLALAANATTKAKGDGRIVGGEVIDISEAPFTAAILNNQELLCGGVILSKNFILSGVSYFYRWNSTAEAPYLVVDIGSLEVRAGSDTYFSEGQVVQVNSIIPHPDFKPYDCNIALLILKSPLTLNLAMNIVPVDLPPSIDVPIATPVTMTGWGTTNFNNVDNVSPVLKKCELEIVDDKICMASYPNGFTERMLCVIAPKLDSIAYRYDVGGPLVLKGTHLLLGIFADKPDQELTLPQLYADIAHKEIREFIYEHTGI